MDRRGQKVRHGARVDYVGTRIGDALSAGRAVRSVEQPVVTLEGLRARREEILRIAAAHGARNVRVFGSVARGQARPDSDVDFLVELEPNRTVLDLSSLILDLQAALRRKVDVVELGRTSPAAELIEREAVPL
ncbi:MAG: nucleotidyltransferase domain-containing protein [Chloroflexi bacterium]|nr:nucleotidyltransferase domain-containing protein [Chloroflexota bacterium]